MSTDPALRIDRLPVQYRAMHVELDDTADRAEGDDRIPISLSSELPVERWFGQEILDHGKKSIDMTYAARGIAFLAQHRSERHYGKIEDITVKDKRLYGRVRFSKSGEAQAIRQDMLDGIRDYISIGYRVNEMRLESTKDDMDTYRITSWTPLEGSTVSIPADPTVGVGRQADEQTYPVRVVRGDSPQGHQGPSKEQRMSDKDEGAAAVAATETRNAERERISLLRKVASNHKASEVDLSRWIDKDFTPEQAKLELFDRKVTETPPADLPRHASEVLSGIDRKESFSVVRALRATLSGDWSKAGFEREVNQVLAKAFKDDNVDNPMSFRFPTYLGTRVTGQLDTATADQGDDLVFTEPGSFIDLLRSRMYVLVAGGQYIGGLSNNVGFPRQSGSGTFSWVGEGPTTALSPSNLTLDIVNATPKNGQSTTQISRQLLAQSVVDSEGLIRGDMAAIHARALDLAALAGTGSNNQPRGILNTTGIGSVTLGTHGGTPTFGKIVDLESAITTANADMGALGYMSTPQVRGLLKQTEQFSGTNGVPIWTGGIAGELNGFRAYATTQVPSNLTKGTSTTVCHALLYGNWNDLIMGEWGTMTVIVDPYTLARQNLIAITSHQMLDIVVRHPESFAAIKDALVT